MVGVLITVAFLVWLGWKAGVVVLSASLRMMAWVFVLAAVLTVLLGMGTVPGVVPMTIAVFWFTGQGLFRLRRGYWRSHNLERLAALLQERKAHRLRMAQGPGDSGGTRPGTWTGLTQELFLRWGPSGDKTGDRTGD